MSRIVPAGYQLMSEVEMDHPKMKVTYGKPDGLGVIREFTFDAATSKWLVPILDVLHDPRIKSVEIHGRSRATVRFVASHWADHKEPFLLGRIDEALNG